MKRTTFCIFSLLLCFLLHSCESFVSVDKRVDDYVGQVEKSISTMSETDLKEADLKMEAFKNEIEAKRSSLTEEQLSNANKAIGRYAGLRLKKGMGELGNQLKDLGNQLEGVIDELTDTLNK